MNAVELFLATQRGPYVTAEDIEAGLAAMDEIIRDAPDVVPVDPPERRGSARWEWTNQAAFWKDEFAGLVPGSDAAQSVCCLLFAKVFCGSWRRLRLRLDLTAEAGVAPEAAPGG